MTPSDPHGRPPDPNRQYDDFQATEIYCPRCRAAMPVRERLLLVLPDGDLYAISCTRCGTQLATQTRKEAPLITRLR